MVLMLIGGRMTCIWWRAKGVGLSVGRWFEDNIKREVGE
jgi:hypothetical protein